MALNTWTQTYHSGAYSSSSSTWYSQAYYFVLKVEEVSTSVTYNTSTIHVTFTGEGENYFHYYDWSGIWSEVKITSPNNTRIAYKDVPKLSPPGTKFTLCDWTGTVPHNEDGTGSISVTAHFDGSTRTNYLPRIFDMSISNKTLTTIPRKSTLSITPTILNDNTKDPDTTAVNITVNKASKTFTDTVQWRWRKRGGTWSSWINVSINSSNKGTISNGDIGWSSKFGGISGDIEIKNTTYNEAGTVLGSNTYPLTLVQGGVPLALYQSGQDTGVSLLGSPVDGKGFYVLDQGPFVLKTVVASNGTFQVLAKE